MQSYDLNNAANSAAARAVVLLSPLISDTNTQLCVKDALVIVFKEGYFDGAERVLENVSRFVVEPLSELK